MAAIKTGMLAVEGGFSQSISAGSYEDEATGKRKRRQFRLKIAIEESLGAPGARKKLAEARLADIVAMRDALVAVGRGAQAEYLMRKAGAAASDPELFAIAISAANVVMTRPSQPTTAADKFKTWGQLADGWVTGELARLYPNAGYAKKTSEETDKPRVEFLKQFIGDVPLGTFCDDDYWRAMRQVQAKPGVDTVTTFKAYAQVLRRVLKIAVELKRIPAWPLGATCKLPKVPKGEAPVFPFLYPEEYVRLVRFEGLSFEYRVLYGFVIREGLRIGEASRIRWEHLSRLPNGRWLIDVPQTKSGRALNFVLNKGTGEALAELRRRMPGEAGPFAWLSANQIKRAAEKLRDHVEKSGTTRERLLFSNGRLRRLREHDLRSTFVTWCKLAGVDNETISQHTGHESSTMIARYNRSKATLEHLGLAPYLPLDEAMGLFAELLDQPSRLPPEPSRPPGGAPAGGGCDGGCDARGAALGGAAPCDSESSMFSAVRETGIEPARPEGHWNLNPDPSSGSAQSPGKPGGEATPEPAGTGTASHPGVTLTEVYARALKAAERAAVDADAPLEHMAELRKMAAWSNRVGAPVLDLVSRRTK